MTTAWLKDVIGYGLHAARPAAGSAGALYYETDTDTLLRDNGTTWDALTLGSPSPLTTKGDVYVHGASDARLPVGSDGQVLTADSTQALGLKWAAASGGSAGAMTLISDVIVGAGGAAAIDFSAIPNTYSHLQLIMRARNDTSQQDVRVQFNGDTGANYDDTSIYGVNNAPGCNSQFGVNTPRIGSAAAPTATAGDTGNAVMTIPDYSRTTYRKTWSGMQWLQAEAAATMFVGFVGGSWRNTAAIASIHLFMSAGNFASGSRATLYGLS